MRNSYDVKLSTLEENLRRETGGRLPQAARREASPLSSCFPSRHPQSTFCGPGSVLFSPRSHPVM